ncbi:MAG: hypothetical protein H6Q51_2468 [Deltaproteobacteria bacterium]|nr:hypothetical protein [Deltaproteobacteria bacterium]
MTRQGLPEVLIEKVEVFHELSGLRHLGPIKALHRVVGDHGEGVVGDPPLLVVKEGIHRASYADLQGVPETVQGVLHRGDHRRHRVLALPELVGQLLELFHIPREQPLPRTYGIPHTMGDPLQVAEDTAIEQPVSFSVDEVLKLGNEFIVAPARGLDQIFLGMPAFQPPLFPRREASLAVARLQHVEKSREGVDLGVGRQETKLFGRPYPEPLEIRYASVFVQIGIENKEGLGQQPENLDCLDELHVGLTHADPAAEEVENPVTAEQIILQKGKVKRIG